MATGKELSRRVLGRFAWFSRCDGRWVLLAVLLIYFLVLAGLQQARGRERAWETLGVPAGARPMIDAHFITATLESHRAGHDVFRENPRDPWGRRMNYPRIWLLLAGTGLSEPHTKALAIGMAAAYLASVLAWAGRINPLEALVLCGVVCAPHLMWVVERGNVDMVIFAILAGALALVRTQPRLRPLLYAAALFCGLLKLYPVAAIWAAARNRLWSAVAWTAAIGAVFAIYLAITWTHVQHILEATPKWSWGSYGRTVVFDLVADQLRLRAGAVVGGRFVSVGSVIAVTIATGLAAVIAARTRQSFDPAGSRQAGDTDARAAAAYELRHTDGFLAGSGIFLGTFLLGTSFDYKLIFLILLLPQTFVWLRRRGTRRIAAWLLAAILLSCWAETLLTWLRMRSVQSPPASATLLQEVFNWLLFVLVAAVNMRLAHGWWRLGTKAPSAAVTAHEGAALSKPHEPCG